MQSLVSYLFANFVIIMKWNQTDREILRLALPCIVSNITVPLLGLVDLSIVGHIGSAAYIAAISVGTMIFSVMYWTMGFLRMGTSGLTAQAYGRDDAGGVRRLLRRALLMGLGVGALFLLLQQPLLQGALWLIGPSEAVAPLVATYYHIVVWGAPAMLGIYGLTGWSVGMQSTRIPMWVAIFQNVANIVASLVFVFALHWDIVGVAMGTLLAQWSGFLLALLLVVRKVREVPKRVPLPRGASHWQAARGDVDIFLRTLCLVAVNLSFTTFGARQGDLLLAVNTLLMTFFTLFSYIMDGFAFAGEALSGKAYGASDGVALCRVVRRLFAWGWMLVAAFTLVYLVGGTSLLTLITNDAGVVAAAHRYLFWTWLIPVAGVAALVYDGLFIGLTATRGMLVSSLVAAAFYFLLALSLLGVVGNHALWVAYLCFLSMRGGAQYAIWKCKIIAKV